MRVLQLITSLRFGGAERLLAELAPRMAAGGASVRVLSVTSTMPLAAELQRRSIEVRSLNCSATIYQVSSLLRAVRDCRREIDNFRPDVIHSHVYMADVIARLAAPNSARLITTLHNIDHWWAQKTRLRSLAKTWVDSWSASLRNTRAIAVSEPVATAAVAALKLPQNRCRVIQNGVDAEQFAYRERTLSQQPIIIQVGRFYPQKGHDISLRAFAALLQTHPRCRLQLVGEGPLEGELRQQTAALGIGDNVEFLGLRSDVAELLGRAHVYWMPSRWEGLPLACLEAMSSGVPVIASDIGTLSAILHSGAGHLIAADQPEQLARRTADVLRSYDAAQVMGKRASARVAQSYSVQNTARDYLSAYSDMLSNTW